ncbi:M24 family metallopeptidase [Natronolimnohabitans innermongolicus]|uniref:Peptidase M24 domain-containing protein n=1 Tax=Natronolimnohabitans innermongolicus JCM 12255 TaxID=1227499 RepID=L9WXN5_9EURY|nr:M24 family metallopeptidase [Natronolimnohabitans innermongolicus]ELY53108.1 hypothetical protein C493_15093 [Natronolimnohabitans innermongolicus JCM 12255]
MTDAETTAGAEATSRADVATHLESRLAAELEARDAAAVVHVGPRDDPAIRYCLSAADGADAAGTDRSRAQIRTRPTAVAVTFDADGTWLVETPTDANDRRAASSAPARSLASRLAERLEDDADRSSSSSAVLAPARIPHDAALYLENAGFELASTNVFDRARAAKTAAERDRIAAAQAAASAGIRNAAAVLADATVENGRLVADGEAVTPRGLRTAIDEGIVAAGAFPDGNTVVNPDAGNEPSTLVGSDDDAVATGNATDTAAEALRPAEPIVLEAAPRGPDGYYGSLVRTLVVDGEGGRDRRAHVGVTQSFRSAAAMVTADAESVTAVEADLEAEVRAFGFEEPGAVDTRVFGVGLEPRERPAAGGDDIEPGSVVRLESAVRIEEESGDGVGDGTDDETGGQWLRIADLLVKGHDGERAQYLAAPSRSLEPSALLE